MRGLSLARVAAQAELLRWRRLARRQAIRVALAVIGVLFLFACLAGLHVAAVMGLTHANIQPAWCVLIVAGVDLLIALILLALASRDSPDRIEQEALEVRLNAQRQMVEATAWTTLAVPLVRMLGTRKAYGIALAALTARYLAGSRR
jgi:hypothetical protein